MTCCVCSGIGEIYPVRGNAHQCSRCRGTGATCDEYGCNESAPISVDCGEWCYDHAPPCRFKCDGEPCPVLNNEDEDDDLGEEDEG